MISEQEILNFFKTIPVGIVLGTPEHVMIYGGVNENGNIVYFNNFVEMEASPFKFLEKNHVYSVLNLYSFDEKYYPQFIEEAKKHSIQLTDEVQKQTFKNVRLIIKQEEEERGARKIAISRIMRENNITFEEAKILFEKEEKELFKNIKSTCNFHNDKKIKEMVKFKYRIKLFNELKAQNPEKKYQDIWKLVDEEELKQGKYSNQEWKKRVIKIYSLFSFAYSEEYNVRVFSSNRENEGNTIWWKSMDCAGFVACVINATFKNENRCFSNQSASKTFGFGSQSSQFFHILPQYIHETIISNALKNIGLTGNDVSLFVEEETKKNPHPYFRRSDDDYLGMHQSPIATNDKFWNRMKKQVEGFDFCIRNYDKVFNIKQTDRNSILESFRAKQGNITTTKALKETYKNGFENAEQLCEYTLLLIQTSDFCPKHRVQKAKSFIKQNVFTTGQLSNFMEEWKFMDEKDKLNEELTILTKKAAEIETNTSIFKSFRRYWNNRSVRNTILKMEENEKTLQEILAQKEPPTLALTQELTIQ